MLIIPFFFLFMSFDKDILWSKTLLINYVRSPEYVHTHIPLSHTYICQRNFFAAHCTMEFHAGLSSFIPYIYFLFMPHILSLLHLRVSYLGFKTRSLVLLVVIFCLHMLFCFRLTNICLIGELSVYFCRFYLLLVLNVDLDCQLCSNIPQICIEIYHVSGFPLCRSYLWSFLSPEVCRRFAIPEEQNRS